MSTRETALATIACAALAVIEAIDRGADRATMLDVLRAAVEENAVAAFGLHLLPPMKERGST